MTKLSASTDTITAISTPPGGGGIGVVRVSGSQSLSILQTVFRPHNISCRYTSHQMYYGHIIDPLTDKIIDEVLSVYMRAPKSYTCEDVVEIHCHGSYLVLQEVIQLLVEKGARIAEPGEFTKRAFLNGRIDLTKAEAVIDILSAKTRTAGEIAQEQLAGALYSRIDAIRKVLVHMKAEIEVAIDFPDEDIEIVDFTSFIKRLIDGVEEPLQRLIDAADQGKVIRDGISVVIVGQPNVGKSGLLNTLLQEERALVTSVAGTTRDSIEEIIDINGMPVKIIDTAGLRDDADIVEALGIKRAMELIDTADLVLFVVDAAKGITEQDIKLYSIVESKPLLIVLNKQDLASSPVSLPDEMAENEMVSLSAKMQTGIEDLKKKIFDSVIYGDLQWEEEGCAPNLRHKDALKKAQKACIDIKHGLEAAFTADLIAVDLQACLDHLGDVVGETTTEDVLDVIFEQFCLGK